MCSTNKFVGLISGKDAPGAGVGFLAMVAIAAFALFLETRRSGGFASALRAWWVDPAVATLGFSGSIWIFDRAERKTGHSKRSGVSVLALVWYWLGVILWTFVVPPMPRTPDGVPSDASGFGYLFVEVAVGVLIYDAVFFFLHWAMHAFGTSLHYAHHSQVADLRARDVLTHSLSDGALQVLVNILVQRRTLWGQTKSRLARALHNLVVTWMLTEAHTSAATPAVARRLFNGVQRHGAHHRGAPYFQVCYYRFSSNHIHILVSTEQ